MWLFDVFMALMVSFLTLISQEGGQREKREEKQQQS